MLQGLHRKFCWQDPLKTRERERCNAQRLEADTRRVALYRNEKSSDDLPRVSACGVTVTVHLFVPYATAELDGKAFDTRSKIDECTCTITITRRL
jgi:hypothetical protein